MEAVKIPKWLWFKKYFDVGYGLMNYLRYLLTIIGIGGIANNWGIMAYFGLGLLFFLSCVIAGYLWVKYNYVSREDEINNILNPFQNQVRKSLKISA